MDRRRYSLFAAATGEAPEAGTLAGPVRIVVGSFAAWRDAARALLRAGVPPEGVQWCAGEAGQRGIAVPAAPVSAAVPGSERRGAASAVRACAATPAGEPRAAARAAPSAGDGGAAAVRSGAAMPVSRALLALLAWAACCRVDDRWSLLYRVLWRRQHGDDSASAAADSDGARLHAMVAIVRAELTRVRAAIRFLERPVHMGAPRFVGWCEPAHDILGLLARHFRARLARVSWMIATPEASVLWDGAALHHTGAPLRELRGRHHDAPWLAYYRHAARALAPERARAALPARARTIAIAREETPPAPSALPSSLEQCRRCELWRHATQPVGGMGAARAAIMLVGEQAGDREDLAGQPFVGPAGMLLDRALAEAGLDRRKVYVTNAVKHFKWTPRGKQRMHKTPAQREVDACRYWLDAELASVRPKVVVALGSTALKAVLDDPHATLKASLGTAVGHGGRWVVATYHPAYVLRVPDPAARQQAFAVLVDALRRAQVLVSAHPQAP